MFSIPEAIGYGWFRRVGFLLAVFLSFSAFAADGEPTRDTEVWLVTYGPGEIYWESFGHNAIWIRDPGLGLDHAFNFGFFDFDQENFFLRFLQGRMMYFSAAQPAREEFAGYINANRSIRAQRLDLSAEQKLHLVEYLLQEVSPDNPDYLYDYFLNNCSTRVRDSIDLAMGGLLRKEFQPVAAPQTWRDQTRKLTHQNFWLYLGLETTLGAPVDREVSRWDEMFIPAEMADALAEVRYSGDDVLRPLVLEDVVLYQSSLEPTPLIAPTTWPRYLLAAIGTLLAGWLLCRFIPGVTAARLARIWLVFSGLAGCVLLFLWFGTDHAVARLNTNLLVLCPFWLILSFWKGHEKFVLLAIAGVSLVAILMVALPPHQYNLDVLAAFLPLNFAAALALSTGRKWSAERPGVPGSVDR